MTTEKITEPCGVLPICKPAGITSHDVVGRIRRLYGTRKVGHTGTLDPMATGVLVILIGRAAKAAEYLSTHEKTYKATLQLGLTTDTEDVTGKVLTESREIPDAATVMATASQFVGEIMQTPPMYSALKVDGKKLVDLARRGIEVERKSRPVTVHSLDCTPITDTDYALTVTCSAGTYIRTLCADIGAILGCGGVMAGLERRATGHFTLADCSTLEELDRLNMDERLERLIPIESLFTDLPTLPLPAFFEKLCRSGCEIYQKKIGTDYPTGTRLRLCSAQGRFFGLGEVADYPGGTAIRAIKQFEI